MENWNSYKQTLEEGDDMESKLAQIRDRKKADHMEFSKTSGFDVTDDLDMEDDLFRELVDLLKDTTESKALIADFMYQREMDEEFQELYGQSLRDYMKSPEYNDSSIHDDEYDDF